MYINNIYFVGGVILIVLLLINIVCISYSICDCTMKDRYKTISMIDSEAENDINNDAISHEQSARTDIRTKSSIVVLFLIIIAVIIGYIGGHFTAHEQNQKNHDINFAGLGAQNEHAHNNSHRRGVNKYVLPNADVIVSIDDNTTFGGEFFVEEKNRLYRYDFQITVGNGADIKYTASFIGQVFKRWKGFHIYGVRDELNGALSGSRLEFVKSNDRIETVMFKPHQKLSPSDHQKLESFFGDILCEHFVELAMKAAALGFVGTKSAPLFSFQNIAQWIYRFATKNDNVDNSEWIDLTEEIRKASEVVLASADAGYQIENLDELQSYLPRHELRRKLLICNNECKCFNDCYGGCGDDCNCWPFVCGSCGCWPYCKDHDYYCSCLGISHYCCWAALIWDSVNIYRPLLCILGYQCLFHSTEHSRYDCSTDCSTEHSRHDNCAK